MSTLTAAAPAPSPAPRSNSRFTREWFEEWTLAILAVFAWVFTFAGLAVSWLTDLPEAVSVGLYILAYLCGGTLATRAAIHDLFHLRVNVDALMVLAALGAAFLGDWLEGAILLALFSSSHALEHYTLDRTRNAVRALMDLAPATAKLERNGQVVEIPVEQLQLDDLILIQPGDRISADAVIATGSSAVDQAAITGESIPVEKHVGDQLFAGTINGHGAMTARVTRLAGDSTLARIAKMVEEAEQDKSDLQEFAEGFEGKYALGVIIFSLLLGIVPIVFMNSEVFPSVYRAITMLVVMSPCALVISTPAATLSALANAARKGVLVKGGGALDLLGSVDTIAFDKTGTLTIGEPRLTDIVTIGSTDAWEVLTLAAAAEQLSEHPIAQAVVMAAQHDGLTLPHASNLTALPGMGITADVRGRQLAIGNERLGQHLGITIPPAAHEHNERLGHEGKSTLLVMDKTGVLAVMAVEDVIRNDVPAILQELHDVGVKNTVMLTGDNARVANAIASRIGLDNVQADLMPDDKLTTVSALKSQGRVAMVGDGVNDAPALATAHVGVAMGAAGTDVALETADVVLMSDDLSRLPYAIGLSRKMRNIIRLNLSFSLGVIAVLAVLTLTVGIPLPIGVFGHEGSTIIVCLNGMRLLMYGRETTLSTRKHRTDAATQYSVVAAN